MIFDIQKAGILKRASAFLLDFILLVILTTGFSLLLSVTLRYNDRLDDYKQLENELEESYGVDPGIGVTEEQYAAWPEEQKLRGYDKRASAGPQYDADNRHFRDSSFIRSPRICRASYP